MIGYSYDIETFPNVFSIALTRLDNTQDKRFVAVWGVDEKPRDAIREIFQNIIKEHPEIQYVSYNGWDFDDIVLNYIEKNNPTNLEIQKFIDSFIKEKNSERKNFIIKPYKRGWMKSYDLMKLFNTIDRVSLKVLAISMNWPLIIDLPFKPGTFIPETSENKSNLQIYNQNDADITAAVYEKLYSEIIQRYNVTARYGINVTNASQSTMGSKLIQDMYCKHTGMSPQQFSKLRTYRNKIDMSEVIDSNIVFETKTLRNLKEELGNTIFKASNFFDIKKQDVNFSKRFLYGKTIYKFAMGGLHSEHPKSKKLISTKDIWMEDADVASYYPNSMINQKVYPLHLGEAFLEVYSPVVKQRMFTKDKIEKYALKISINAIFGKMGSDKEPYYDRFCLYQVTINGQFYLLVLVEWFEEAGIEVFYANTDGVTVWLTKNKVDEYHRICKKWQETFNFILEFATIEKALIRDVNNYTMLISESKDGRHFKEKGEFIRDVKFGKKPFQQIVPKAVHEYFYNNIPLEQTIRNSNTIYDYAMYKMVGGTQTAEFHYLTKVENEFVKKIEQLQKDNRFYACTVGKGGKFFKNKNDQLHNILASSGIDLLNNVKDTNPSNYFINHNYYLSQAKNTINNFDNEQLTLF